MGGETDRALETLERAIASGFGDDETLTKDSDLLSLHRDARFERLVRLARDLELYGGNHDDDVSGWRAALPRFVQVSDQHPTVGRAWFNLGYARLRARDARGSLEAFRHSLDLDYRRPTTLYNLACAAAQIPDRDAALQWLERAQAAGMRLEEIAPRDRDLDPLRSDARFQTLEARWDQSREKSKGKRWKKS